MGVGVGVGVGTVGGVVVVGKGVVGNGGCCREYEPVRIV